MMKMEVEVTRQYKIKPSSPTPHHLRTHRLSWFDQRAYDGHVYFILFYSPRTKEEEEEEEEVLSTLKRSLSEALTIYYPLAGRMSPNSPEVECNDEGVDVFEAHCTTTQLSQVLNEPGIDAMRQLVPRGPQSCGGPLLVIQLTTFARGGVAIGVCIFHKVADGCSLSMFLAAWAAVARRATYVNKNIPRPNFGAASLFPPTPHLSITSRQTTDSVLKFKEKTVTRRFVLSESSITALRKPQSTQAVAVMALIWRCARRAQGTAVGSADVVVPVNLRGRLTRPVLPGALFGNLVTSVVVAAADGDDMEEKLMSSISSVGWKHVRRQVERGSRARELPSDVGGRRRPLVLVSWLGFAPYSVDFGWGKPVWVGPAGPFAADTVTLLDGNGNGDGMEAWVTLEEKEMHRFERDEELLSCTKSGPDPLFHFYFPSSLPHNSQPVTRVLSNL